jgi:hypothetical protein
MILRDKVKIQQHIENLKELKSKYEGNGDTLNAIIAKQLIKKQEAALKSFNESGD